MLCLEWWSFEVLAFMAGYISVDATAAHVVILNTHVVIIMVPLGAQVAATVLVGQAMGEGNHKKGRRYFYLVAVYNFVLDGLIALAIVSFSEGLAGVYTSEASIIPLVTDGYKVMAIVLMLHGLAMVQAGAVRGLGMLQLATWMVLFAFYFVALPAAYFFTFSLTMGVVGLWWGVVAGSIAEIVLYVIILRFYCDWDELAITISTQLRITGVFSPNASMSKLSRHSSYKQ